jgi:hypothetical protein
LNKKKILNIIALVPIILSYLIFLISPTYALTQPGLKWYSKIDVAYTDQISPDFDINNYTYCTVSNNIDYSWGGNATECNPDNPEFFTNLWIGYITVPETGLYTFYTSNDDGMIVKINGIDVVYSWWEQGAWLYNGSGQIELEAGVSYEIKVLQHESGGAADARLFWTIPNSQTIDVVPPSAFSQEPIVPEPDVECWDGSLVFDISECPSEPTPTPTPTETVEPTPEPTETVEPTPEPTETETVEPTPEPTVEPTIEPTVEPTKEPEPTNLPTPEETALEPKPEPSVKPTEQPELDGVNELLNKYESEPIPADVLIEMGIDYSELPPDQPVTLENGVVLTAEVADALQVFENPSEILGAVFTDPGKALTAFANIGADMTPEKRKESQKVVLAAVIAGQVLTTASMVGRIR